MRKKFKHLIFALLVIPSILIAGYFTYVEAASISSTNFNVLNPIISNGLGSVSSLNFGLGSSIGQVVIGKSASSNFQLWSGYQYFTQPVQFTLLGSSVSNTTGAVSLQWMDAEAYLSLYRGRKHPETEETEHREKPICTLPTN
jgi:hypothetical protein